MRLSRWSLSSSALEVRSYSDSRWGKANGELVVIVEEEEEKRRGNTGRRIGGRKEQAEERRGEERRGVRVKALLWPWTRVPWARRREAVICLARKEVQFL